MAAILKFGEPASGTAELVLSETGMSVAWEVLALELVVLSDLARLKTWLMAKRTLLPKAETPDSPANQLLGRSTNDVICI